MPVDKKKLAKFVSKDAAPPYRGGKGKDEEEGGEAKEAGGSNEEASEEGGEVDAENIGAQVQAGNGSPKLMKLIKGVTEENNPPQWVADEDIWEEAKAAVEPKWEDYDSPYGVVVHVYKKMGGTIKGGGE